MAAIDPKLKSEPLRKTNFIFLFIAIILFSCNASHQNYTRAMWIKDTDNPGIQYRPICTGKSFKGSKFSKWEIEIFNDYTQAIALTIVLVTEKSGEESSERKTIAIPPASLRKTIFFNCTLNCQQKAKIDFLDVQMLP